MRAELPSPNSSSQNTGATNSPSRKKRRAGQIGSNLNTSGPPTSSPAPLADKTQFLDLEQLKRIRATLPSAYNNGSTSLTQERSILGRKGVDRYSLLANKKSNLKSLLKEDELLETPAGVGPYGPKKVRRRLKSSTIECVLVSRKYSDQNPFKPIYVPGAAKLFYENSQVTGREENMGFDQYAKIEIPENEDDKAVAGYERYFEQTYKGGKTGLTSDNTLAQLQSLEPHDLIRGIAQAKTKLTKAISWLDKLNSSLFPQWNFELSQGFNLLFYGYGSKRSILEKFARQAIAASSDGEACKSQAFVINGYYPDLTLRSIITYLTQDVLKISNCPINSQKPLEVVDVIKNYFLPKRGKITVDRLYLVIHNLDGENLRTTSCQQFFSELCKIKQISVLASVDHIHGPLLWDRADISGMNFIWHELATYAPYQAETSFESSPLLPLGAHPGGQISIRAIVHVLASVNDKAKGIFKILVKAQLDSEQVSSPSSLPSKEVVPNSLFASREPVANKLKKDAFSKNKKDVVDHDLGLTSDQLYTLSRKKFLVSAIPAFQANLREFLDHHLIKETKSTTAIRYHVPLPPPSLKAILDLEELKNIS